jgi:hypothetical protein
MPNPPPFSTSRLSELLSQKWGFEILVVFSRELSQGKSGAGVCLVEIHAPRGIEYAVVKIAGAGKNDDLQREAAAMDQVSELWPLDVLPQRWALFREPDPDLVPDRPEAAVLVTSFVQPKDADVITFKELLGRDMGRSTNALTQLTKFYGKVLDGQRASARVTGSALEHFLGTLGDNLREKLTVCDWLGWAGIDPGRSQILVGGTAYPNAAYVFNSMDCWDDMWFTAPWIPLHGDLNADNLMILPDDRQVFIDFEKFRPGMAYWDLAFLLMWTAQIVLLDDREAPLDVLLDVARGYAATDGSRSEDGLAFGSNLEPFAALARQFLYPLGGPLDSTVSEGYASDSIRKSAALCVAGAALARAFYQFRAATRARDAQAALRNRRHGLFFYALSCAAFQRSEVLRLPLCGECQSLSALDAVPATSPKNEPNLKAALGLPIRSTRQDWPAAFTKLVFEIPLPETARSFAGWQSPRQGLYGYFSKLNIATNSALRQAVFAVLVRDGAHNPAMPLVFELKGEALRELVGEAKNLEISGMVLTLAGLDLVPLVGARALLGMRFEVPGCQVEAYLKWISARNFSKCQLTGPRRHNGDKGRCVSLGAVRDELATALLENRAPRTVPARRPASDPDMPSVLQYVLWPDFRDETQPLDGTAAGRAQALIATLSRPKENYPKQAGNDLQSWRHPDSPRSLYCLSPKAFTLFSSPDLEFNRHIKPDVFMQANYILWLLARELARTGDEQAALAVARGCEESLRAGIFEKCFAYFRRP